MNLLLNKLPDCLEIDGQEYPIKTNFREWIKFEMVMMNQESSNEDRLAVIVEILKTIPKDINKTIEQLVLFYQCGGAKQKSKGSINTKKVYDYEYDQFLIYTAFLQYYKIDLNSTDYMHWWTFRQMFLELPDESKIKKVMMYRTIRINQKMSKEQRQFYGEMKVLYALPDNRTEKQKAVSFGSILANGMKVNK